MFSDRARTWKLVGTIGLMVALGVRYSSITTAQSIGYSAAIRSPDTQDGTALLFPLWEVTHIRDANVYEISKAINGVPVHGSSDGLEVGDTVTIKGHFRAKDRGIVVAQRIDHPLRPLKGGLSLIALLICVVLAPRFFSWSEGRVVIRG